MAALLFLIFLGISRSTTAEVAGISFTPTTPPLGVPPGIEHAWAAYTPFFPVEPYSPPPQSCIITQVNILQRHGARYPTSGASAAIKSAVAKIQSVHTYTDPRLDFLKNFTYDLGQDDLVPFGAAQSFDAGQLAFTRYQGLFNEGLPFVRASSSSRVVDSATNWTAGVAFASQRKYTPSLSVVLDESANDTLTNHMCPKAGNSDNQTDTWQSVYAVPIAARLNTAAPGANLTLGDVSSLLSLCPFETIVKEKPSAFCNLFDQSDFDGFEYLGDLDKYYGTGYGQPLGPVQGVGWVNELLARLTNKPVVDHTQTNSTLDSSPVTFPLNRTIYADFSHDNELIAIFSAIGLFKQASALSPTQPDPTRRWFASKLVPFASRLVTERLECNGRPFVRMLVNEALQDLKFCGAGSDGMCELDRFVQSQSYARNDGNARYDRPPSRGAAAREAGLVYLGKGKASDDRT